MTGNRAKINSKIKIKKYKSKESVIKVTNGRFFYVIASFSYSDKNTPAMNIK